ncbi:MAG: AbrB/MazE/SpoVT family DNA-binding domain-containing protein [bacterium]
MKTQESVVITRRGQVSIPKAIRVRAGLKPGQRLLWLYDAASQFTVMVCKETPAKVNVASARGYCKKLMPAHLPKRSDALLAQLREGEE